MNHSFPPLLRQLLLLPSPTGAEQTVQRFVANEFQGVANLVEPDVAGNLLLALNPGAKRKVMLASHCDQIGFLVKYISADGFIYVDPLGGADLGVILGEHLIIHNRRGAVAGIFGRKPFQFQMGSQAGQIPSNNKTWVDIGAKSREEAAEAVDIGDYATYPLRITELRNSLIASPGLDNKTGLYVSLEVLRRLAGTDLSFGLYVVSSTQEEIGSRGATVAGERLRPDIGIAVDTVPATDDPGFDLPSQTHIACTLGRGPTLSMGPNTNPAVGELLTNAARQHAIEYQVDPSAKAAPNDSKALQTAGIGVAAASVGIPLRNMHTQVEVVSLDDLEKSISLLCHFLASLKEDVDLQPFSFHGG